MLRSHFIWAHTPHCFSVIYSRDLQNSFLLLGNSTGSASLSLKPAWGSFFLGICWLRLSCLFTTYYIVAQFTNYLKQRKWFLDKKLPILLEGLRGVKSVADICRDHKIRQPQYYKGRGGFLEGGRKALSKVAAKNKALRAETEKLRKIIGKQANVRYIGIATALLSPEGWLSLGCRARSFQLQELSWQPLGHRSCCDGFPVEEGHW